MLRTVSSLKQKQTHKKEIRGLIITEAQFLKNTLYLNITITITKNTFRLSSHNTSRVYYALKYEFHFVTNIIPNVYIYEVYRGWRLV